MKILLIPDVHQDIPWVLKILEKEKTFDKIVFIGDYFDYHHVKENTGRYSAKNTAKFLVDLKQNLGDKVEFLFGNHDIQYYEYSVLAKHNYSTKGIIKHPVSGYSRSSASDIHRIFYENNFWKNFKLYHIEGEYLFTHAGLNEFYVPNAAYGNAKEETLKVLSRLDDVSAAIHNAPGILFDIGPGRVRYPDDADNQISGGIIWQDSTEIAPWSTKVFTQIVGHNPGHDFRKIGETILCDGNQSIYATIEDGEFKRHDAYGLKSYYNSKLTGEWL